jgi:hypothetical protein
MTTKTALRATADASVDSSHPNRNLGDRTALHLNDSDWRAYVEFSLKSLPLDAIVQEANLKLTAKTVFSGDTVTARRITQRWREDRITWNNVPTVSGVNTGSEVVTAGIDDEVTIDVTAMVAQALAGANFHGIRLEVSTAGDRKFAASEAQDRSERPRLVVFYGETPIAPTHLHPRGGHACDAAKPTLAWDCDSQSASWVQVSTTDVGFTPAAGFASPEFDDGGWIDNVEQLYDLATTAYGGVPDDATRYWTVAVKDEDGNESQFSEPARFERHSYGTFTIDSPTTDVSTSTPTVLTTFTGRTLKRIEWSLARSQPKFPWPHVIEGVSDDDDFEIRGVNKIDTTYRLVLKAFDEFQRGNVPNEGGYVRAVVTFGYTPGATDPITGLVLEQAEPSSPVILATWSRSVAPDSFRIYVNNVLESDIDSGDAFVSGTTYEALVWSADPKVSNTIRVVAVDANVNSVHAQGVITPQIIAAWLLAPDEGIALPIFGRPRFGTSIAESGETYVTLDGVPKRIVDSVSGLKGKISGELVEIAQVDDQTAAQARENLLAFKELNAGANIRLAYLRRNVPVLLEEISSLDEWTEVLEELYHVEIGFWELPE